MFHDDTPDFERLPAKRELRLAGGRVRIVAGQRADPLEPVGDRVAVREHRGLHAPWVRWRALFRPRATSAGELQARATDGAGQTQAATVPFNDAGYLFWAVVRHPIQVVG